MSCTRLDDAGVAADAALGVALSDDDREHLKRCEPCRASLDRWREARVFMDEELLRVGRAEPSDELGAQARRASAESRRHVGARWLLVAATLAAGAAAVLLTRPSSPPPPTPNRQLPVARVEPEKSIADTTAMSAPDNERPELAPRMTPAHEEPPRASRRRPSTAKTPVIVVASGQEEAILRYFENWRTRGISLADPADSVPPTQSAPIWIPPTQLVRIRFEPIRFREIGNQQP